MWWIFLMSIISRQRFRDVSIYLIKVFSSICLVKVFSVVRSTHSVIFNSMIFVSISLIKTLQSLTSSSHLRSCCLRQFIWFLQFLFSRTTVWDTSDRSSIFSLRLCLISQDNRKEISSLLIISMIANSSARECVQWLIWLSLRRQNRWSSRTISLLVHFWSHVYTWSKISESD